MTTLLFGNALSTFSWVDLGQTTSSSASRPDCGAPPPPLSSRDECTLKRLPPLRYGKCADEREGLKSGEMGSVARSRQTEAMKLLFTTKLGKPVLPVLKVINGKYSQPYSVLRPL